jgi:biotin carboxylase
MFLIGGIRTSIPLHLRILDEADFIEGNLSTRFMERFAPRE